MEGYTPTTQEVRTYASTGSRFPAEWFDRWLAAHDVEVATKALEDAADDWTQGAWAEYIPPSDANRPAIILGVSQGVGDFLRARAARMTTRKERDNA